MGRTYTAAADDWEMFPSGTSAVVLTALHFVGRHAREWQGQTSTHELVCLEWTAPGAGAEGGDLSVWEALTVAFGQKSNLYKRIRALVGGEPPERLDLATLLGRGALVEVEHRETPKGAKARVIGATPLPRGMAPPTWTGPLAYSDVADPDAQPDPDTAPAIVRWMLERRITEEQTAPTPAATPPQTPAPAPHPPRAPARGGPEPDLDDDIPF